MEEKDNSSVASRAWDNDDGKLSYEDKYFLIQGENQKLKRQIGKLYEILSDWREGLLSSRPKAIVTGGAARISCPLCLSRSFSGLCGRGSNADL